MDCVYTLFSGSTGNSCYIGGEEDGILIDAGKNFKTLTASMCGLGLHPEKVRAVFVTHFHSDHISSLQVFAKHFPRTPICGSVPTLCWLVDNGVLPSNACLKPVESCGLQVGKWFVTPFDTPHDAPGSCGYTLEDGCGKVGVCTDLGHFDDYIEDSLSGCRTLVIESNHDENILRAGSYPYVLKQRILGDYGHLSNPNCASLCARLMQRGARDFVLAHLSRENNIPEVAYDTTARRLCDCGAEENTDFRLRVAPADLATRHYQLS